MYEYGLSLLCACIIFVLFMRRIHIPRVRIDKSPESNYICCISVLWIDYLFKQEVLSQIIFRAPSARAKPLELCALGTRIGRRMRRRASDRHDSPRIGQHSITYMGDLTLISPTIISLKQILAFPENILPEE